MFDACIDVFCTETLHFSPGWEQGPDKQKYINALTQLRLSTRQSGGGLAAATAPASDVWPCALMASINSFARWLEKTPQKPANPTPRDLPPFGEPGNTHVRETLTVLVGHFDSLGIECGDVKAGAKVPDLPSLTRDECPTQEALYHAVLDRKLQQLKQLMGPDDDCRLKHLARSTVPLQHKASFLFPHSSEENEEKSLHHSPMGYLSLACSEELSDFAFIFVTALHFGVPSGIACALNNLGVPNSRNAAQVDCILNDVPGGCGIHTKTHNIFLQTLCGELRRYGWTFVSDPRRVPSINDENSKGDAVSWLDRDIIEPASHLGQEVSATTPTVIDVTVVHDFNKDHKLKENATEESARVKDRKYRNAYLRERNMAFIPLVVTSMGLIHPEFLRLLWKASTHAARNGPTNIQRGFYGPDDEGTAFKLLRGRLFHRLRMTVAVAAMEASVARVIDRYVGLRQNRIFMELVENHRPHWVPPASSTDCSGLPHRPAAPPPFDSRASASSSAPVLGSLGSPAPVAAPPAAARPAAACP